MHDMDKYVRVTLSVTRTKLEQAESELRLASSKEFVGGKLEQGSRSDFLSKC